MRVNPAAGYVTLIPWVHNGEAKRCSGHKSSSPASVKESPSMPPDQRRCRNGARWYFVARRGSTGRTGRYCWHHLLARGLYADDVETSRTESWFVDNADSHDERVHKLWLALQAAREHMERFRVDRS